MFGCRGGPPDPGEGFIFLLHSWWSPTEWLAFLIMGSSGVTLSWPAPRGPAVTEPAHMASASVSRASAGILTWFSITKTRAHKPTSTPTVMDTLTPMALLLRIMRSMISGGGRRLGPTAPSWSTDLRVPCTTVLLRMASPNHRAESPPPFWTFRSIRSSCSLMTQKPTPSTSTGFRACRPGPCPQLAPGTSSKVPPPNLPWPHLPRPSPGVWTTIRITNRRRKGHRRVTRPFPRGSQRLSLHLHPNPLSLQAGRFCKWPNRSPNRVSSTLRPCRALEARPGPSLCLSPSPPRQEAPQVSRVKRPADPPVQWAAPTPAWSAPAASLTSFLYGGLTPVDRCSRLLPVHAILPPRPRRRVPSMDRWTPCMQTPSTAMKTAATFPLSRVREEISTRAQFLESTNSLGSLIAATSVGAGRGAGTGSTQRTGSAPTAWTVASAWEMVPASSVGLTSSEAHRWNTSWGPRSCSCRKQLALRTRGSRWWTASPGPGLHLAPPAHPAPLRTPSQKRRAPLSPPHNQPRVREVEAAAPQPETLWQRRCQQPCRSLPVRTKRAVLKRMFR